MPTDIKCPGCGHHFEPNDAIRDEVQKELLTKAKEWQKRKDEEFKQKEALLIKQLQQQKEEAEKSFEEEKNAFSKL